MKPERVGADGSSPPRAEARHHHGGVANRADHANEAAEGCEQQAFAEKEPADLGGRVADGAEETDLARTLLHTEPEEQRSQ